MVKVGRVESDAALDVFADLQLAAGRVSESEMKIALYRSRLLAGLTEGKADEGLTKLRVLLGLSEAEADEAYEAAAAPIYRQRVQTAAAGSLGSAGADGGS